MAKQPQGAPLAPTYTIRHVDGVMHLIRQPDSTRPMPPRSDARLERAR